MLKQQPHVLRHSIKEMHVFDCLLSKHLRRYWMPRFERSIAELEAQLAACPQDGSAARLSRSLSAKILDRKDHLAIVQARRRSTSLRRYEQYFADRTSAARSEVEWFGEITPAYALLPAEGFRAILSVYADASFIFLMRDPVDRLWSALKMRHEDDPHLDPIATFEDALRTEWIVRRSAYEETLSVLDEVVPPAQQLVVFYEDLFGPSSSALGRMGEFLGIEHIEADRSTVRTQGWARRAAPGAGGAGRADVPAHLPVGPRPLRSSSRPVAGTYGRGGLSPTSGPRPRPPSAPRRGRPCRWRCSRCWPRTGGCGPSAGRRRPGSAPGPARRTGPARR